MVNVIDWRARVFVIAILMLSGACTTEKKIYIVADAASQTGPADAAQSADSPPEYEAVSLAATSLPTAYQGQAYYGEVMARGGTPPYAWELQDGELPPGLGAAARGSMLVVSGMPGTAGEYEFTIRVEDGTGRTDSRKYSLTVHSSTIVAPGDEPAGLYRPDACTTVCEGDEWLSGVEVRGVPLDDNALAVIANVARNRGEQQVEPSARYVRYETGYQDKVYFTLPDAELAGRVVVVSRCPLYNLGLVRRLDLALVEAAELYVAAGLAENNDAVFLIRGSRAGRIYYAQTRGTYSRAYLEVYSSNLDGFLDIPAGARHLSLGVVNAHGSSCLGHISSLWIDDQPMAEERSSGSDYYVFWIGSVSEGTHGFRLEYGWCHEPYAQNHEYREYFLDAAGEDLANPIGVSIGGTLQPTVDSVEISALRLPE